MKKKIKRNDLIRPQPSLGDQLINIGVKEGVGLLGKLLDRGDKNKALAVIIEKQKEQMSVLISMAEFIRQVDNRLKEIDTALEELLDWARTQKEREAQEGD